MTYFDKENHQLDEGQGQEMPLDPNGFESLISGISGSNNGNSTFADDMPFSGDGEETSGFDLDYDEDEDGSEANEKQSKEQAQPDGDGEIIDIHLGVVVSPDEFTGENIAVLKQNLLAQRNVRFCAEQFNDRVIQYNIVGVDVMPDAVTALMDDVIDDDGELNSRTYASAVNIVIDIGYGTTDVAAIQGFDLIPDSAMQFALAANDAFVDIAHEIERKYNCGYIEAAYVANIVRYPLGVCSGCGAVSASAKTCSCGDDFQMKKNMIKIGRQTFDVSDIVRHVFNEKTDALAAIFKRYLDSLFKVRGINRSSLDTILIVGGGSELFGKPLKEKLATFVGEYVEIKKATRAIWRSVSGLSKYIMLKREKAGKKNFKRYAFVDVGNFATKAKLMGSDTKEIGKPVELLTRIATPVKLGSIALRKAHPLMDLSLEISSDGNGNSTGDGTYFVSHIANRGKNLRLRNSLTPKTHDELVYVMINSAIGVLLARDKSMEF